MNLVNKKQVFAVIGVSENTEKYGYKVFLNLKQKGYEVYPINPKYKIINNNKCYSSLKELPVIPDVVVSVVPPQVTNEIVKEIKKLNIKKIWMQPGSESSDAIEFCKKNSIEVVSNTCIMIRTN